MSDLTDRLNGVANRKDQFEDDATLVSRALIREAVKEIERLEERELQLLSALEAERHLREQFAEALAKHQR
jgi:hypothetical protein